MSNPMFTQRHYVAIARHMKTKVRPLFVGNEYDVYIRLVQEYCEMFESDNDRFDNDKFMAACDL